MRGSDGSVVRRTLPPQMYFFGPIDPTSVQLQSKTDHFYAGFSQLSQVRPFESSGVMERAMGIEPKAESL